MIFHLNFFIIPVSKSSQLISAVKLIIQYHKYNCEKQMDMRGNLKLKLIMSL